MAPQKQTVILAKESPSRRAAGQVIVCLLLLGAGLASLFRAAYAGLRADALAALGVRMPFGLAVVANAGWGLALVWLAWQLWQGRNLSARVVFLLVGSYSLFQVIWWRVFVVADYARLRWPFAVLVMALFAGVIGGWSLWRNRQHARQQVNAYRPDLQA
ncbi:MAG: hypothetical protein JXN59_05585 [Anaerolineae bacterium]|nr:hypothetical protein [Anaerolineae bacterium]